MDMKELLGDLYSEEIEARLKDKKLVDLNEGGYVSKAKYDGEKKELIDKYNALNSEKVRAEEEYQKSKMTADELREKELSDIKNELKANKIERNEMEVRSMFAQAGIEEEDYKDLLKTIVKEDKDETKLVASSMINILAKQKEAVSQRVKEEMMKKTPTPPVGNSNSGTPTLEEFKSASSTRLMEIKKDYPELFNQYIKL